MDKLILRTEHKNKRLAQDKTDAKNKSHKICETLFSLPEYKKAKKIMVYLSAKGEVLTHEIIVRAKADGKELSAPVCRENSLMDAVRFSDFEDLKEGAFHILAPTGNETFLPEELDLIIAPGCVFGRNKHRIGYGKGYYDRFIKKAKNACTVGLAYSFNLIDSVPKGEFDMPLNIIITENEVIL